MVPYIFSKDTFTDTAVQFDISSLLKFGETLVSITVMPVTPVSTPPLVIEQQIPIGPVLPLVDLLLKGGHENISYGAQIQIVTDARQLAAQIAVIVKTAGASPYVQQDATGYTDLVDTIEAGAGTVGTAVFVFPSDINPINGYVNWEFMDSDAIVYASGNAYSYEIQANGLSNIVRAKSIINIPSTVPPSAHDCKYQLRYTLKLPETDKGSQNTYFSSENVTVIGLTTVPIGTQDVVETRGRVARTEIVIDSLFDTVAVSVYADNKRLGTSTISEVTRVGSGYFYAANFDTTSMPESLEPYTIIWEYSNASDPTNVYSEQACLWVVNPTILTAIADVKAKVNKSRTTLYGSPDLLFPATTILTWMRRGRDSFNGGGGGQMTNFTMTSAKGPVREWWLLCTELGAIEAQYMAEGEKAFEFSGAAISLNVNRTDYLDNMASKIQARIDNELKPFKQNLIIKGNTGGDGSADTSRLRAGAIGTVGITITAASPWGAPFGNALPYPNWTN